MRRYRGVVRHDVAQRVLSQYSWLILGDRGSGKTAFMALLSQELEKQGYKIMWIFPEVLVSRPWPWEVMSPKDLAKALKDEAKRAELGGMAIMIDETWVLANPRLRRRNSDRVTALSRFLAVARHLDVRIAMSTQLVMGLDKALRLWAECLVVKRVSLTRYAMETQRPTWLFRLDMALRMAHGRSLRSLQAHEAVIVADEARLIRDIPLPRRWNEAMSKYYSLGPKGHGRDQGKEGRCCTCGSRSHG